VPGNLTRINNNQITDAVSGNTQFGINANTKVQPYSITSTLLANNFTYGNNFTITGNLTVQGNSTAIDTTNTTIEDPLLLLASTQAGSPTVDIGFIGQRGSSNNIAFVWDESSSTFVTVFTDSGATDNTVVNILSYADFATANANVTGNLIAGNVSLLGNVTSALNVTGNIAAGNIAAVGLISATGNIATGNFIIGNGYYITGINPGNVAVTKIVNGGSYGNIASSDGNLVIAIGATSNVAATFYDTGVNFGGNISVNGNVTGANFVGNLSGGLGSNLTVNNYVIKGGNYDGITLAMPVGFGANLSSAYEGGVTLAAGAGGTTAGTLLLDSTGNISISGNVYAAGNLSVVGTAITGNIIPSTSNTYSLGNATNVFSSLYLSPDTLYLGTTKVGANTTSNTLTVNNAIAVTYSNGNADITATGNVISGNVNTGNLSLTGNVISALNVTLNATAGNVIAVGNVSAGGNVVAFDAVNAANLSLTGNVISTLNVTGNTNSNNVNTVNDVRATGNVHGANFITGGLITATGNVTAGNIITGGLISATGNVNSANVIASANISATGNISTQDTFVGNALYGNNLTITSTYDGLKFSVTGNINSGNTYITNLINPENPQDAATKSYVDAIANGLQVKASSNTATTGSILATTTQSYTYSNGTAGVGATITFGAVGNVTIDTVLLTSGMRVLIKDEPLVAPTDGTTPSAAYNGIYTVTTAGSPSAALVLTRATDDDTPSEMYSAYTFITSPIIADNSNSGWASTNTPTNPGPITVGTTFYIWSQFSSVAEYTGANGINITGTLITTVYDGNTIGINGSGQLHVPAYALFTTPNIGSATGANLSILGSVIGNIFQANTVSVIGNAQIGNISTGNISLSGNVLTDLNVTTSVYAGNLVTNGNVTAVGNVYGGNISSANIYGTNIGTEQIVFGNATINGLLTSVSTLTTDGNNVTAGGNINASGNVIAGNFQTIGSGGNISGANYIKGNILSVTGNVYGANVTTVGNISATGNIATGNYFVGNGYYITGINPGNVAVTKIVNGGSYGNIASSDGNLVIAIGATSNTVATFYDTGVDFAGNLSVAGNVIGGNITTIGLVTATGNVTGGNILTGGLVSATGDINTSGNVSAVGNVIAGNISTSGASGNITGANIVSAVTFTATGNVYAVNVFASTDVSATGNVLATANITGGNILTANIVSAGGNIQSGTTMLVDTTTGSVTLGANVTLTAGATLAINATDSMLIPVGTTGDRPGTPATGMLRYNSTLSSCEIWNGAAWVAVGGSSYTVITNEQFNGDGSTVAFTLGSSQTTDSCIVTINGVVQIPTTAYSVSGIYPTCVLTFTEAPAISDIIDVREITSTSTVTAISNSPGNAIVSVSSTIGQVNIAGNLVAQVNATAPSLTGNSTMSFQLISNTSLAILVRGTDGVTRSTTLTLS